MIRNGQLSRRPFVRHAPMQRTQLTFSQVSDLSVLVNILEVNKERTVRVRRSHNETHDWMAGDLNICVKRSARVRQQLLVFFSTIRVDDFTANLSVPAILCSRGSVEIDRVTVFI